MDYDKNSSKIGDEPRPNHDTVWSLLRFTWCEYTVTIVLCRYNKTVKVWLFRDAGSIHYPCASGNKHGLGAMETAYIPHNHILTV